VYSPERRQLKLQKSSVTIEAALESNEELGEWTRWVLGLAFIVGILSQMVFKGSQTLAALFFLTYLFAAGFVGYTGYLGGELVLEHGAGFRNILSLSPLPLEEPPKGP